MKVLAIEKETGTGSVDQVSLEEEARRVYQLYKEDKIREIYFHKQKHIAVMMLEAQNMVEARAWIDTLPLVKNNVIEFDLIELVPYDGFDRIIDN